MGEGSPQPGPCAEQAMVIQGSGSAGVRTNGPLWYGGLYHCLLCQGHCVPRAATSLQPRAGKPFLEGPPELPWPEEGSRLQLAVGDGRASAYCSLPTELSHQSSPLNWGLVTLLPAGSLQPLDFVSALALFSKAELRYSASICSYLGT